MKRIEDIEKMGLEEMESAALEKDLPVPPGLEARIKAALAAKSAFEKKQEHSPFRWVPYAAVAVAASLAVFAILPKNDKDPLQDTYDNPYLAYAQLEATFRKISEKMADGVNLAGKAGETANKSMEIVNKITEQ